MVHAMRRTRTAARPVRLGLAAGCLASAMASQTGFALAAMPASLGREQQDPAPRARAAWRDRTREVSTTGGASVRSDLSPERTATMVAAESAALRRLVDPWGQPAGARRLWCFASRGEFEDVLRTELGADARGREAIFIEHRGDRLVAACDAAVAEDRLARDLAAAIAERHLLERLPAAPPWLRAAVPSWFGEAMAYGRWQPGLVGASMQESIGAAARERRLIGADRVLELDRNAWRANEAAGSGATQQAESAALLATLLGDPADRSAAAQARRAALGRWWRGVLSGGNPRRVWSEVFGTRLAPPMLEAVQATMTRPPSDLERAIREARWLAEGRLHLEARGETVEDPETLRARLLESGFSIQEPCVASTGRCSWSPALATEPAWSPTLRPIDASNEQPPPDREPRWSGAVGPSLLEVVWTRPGGGGWRYAIRVRGE